MLGATALTVVSAPSASALPSVITSVSTAKVKISDTTPRVGQLLTSRTSAWKPAPVALAYQWFRGATAIAGATSATYQVQPSDLGGRLKVEISGTHVGLTTATRKSSSTSKVARGYLSTKPKPTISDTSPNVGQTLTANPGSWKPAPVGLAYQWYKVSAKGRTKTLKGATSATYTVVASDKGYKLKVKLSGSKAGYHSASKTSSKTAKVVLAAPAPITPRGGDSDVRLGSFNLSGSNTDSGAGGEHQAWSNRMPVAVSQILGEKLDVLGVQEAYWGRPYPTQYNQLRDALNRAGGTYEVVDSVTSSSAGDRILYNSSTLRLVDHGVHTYSAQAPGKQLRYFVWATFRSVSTGKSFFFANTHLDPYSPKDTTAATVKVREWRELIATIPQLNTGRLPVVSVGDFNTSKWWKEVIELLPAMKAAGFGDVMNQQYQTNPAKGVRAESVENGWVNSFNGYRRSIVGYAYEDNHAKVGNGIDWIFATNSLRVKKWKVVIDYNPSTLQITGVIPSDHSMLSAIIVL
ncbi:MAG: endonuclease/exonuclease/phosphatase family protein [Propionicimonas sp.]